MCIRDRFRVDPKTVTRWAVSGKLTSLRTLGGHRRYRADDVYALLEASGRRSPVGHVDEGVSRKCCAILAVDTGACWIDMTSLMRSGLAWSRYYQVGSRAGAGSGSTSDGW